MEDAKYWLAFSLVPHIGAKRMLALHTAFGSLKRAWGASRNDLSAAGLGEKTLTAFLKHRQVFDLDAAVQRVAKAQAWLLPLVDNRYPSPLRHLPDAPSLLYVRGTLLPQDERALAVVGTRKASRTGQDAARSLSQSLAARGVTIVSGLAHGIDAAAHTGALQGGGRTIAVLGSGIDIIYPRDNQGLAERIIETGAIISEFPLTVQPQPRNFPRRNRVISGLTLGVLVVEAPERSGALITASQAAEQGREVFAVPGSIFNKMAAGSNRLIQDGARLVMTAEDVLDELDIAYNNNQTRVRTESIAPSDDIEQQILDCLEADPIHVDDLVRLSGLSTASVSSTLTILELKGLALMVGPMQYCRAGHIP